jgi:hypothetical protein
VRFADGSEEAFDRIVYATGYRISLPFLEPSLVASRRRELPCTGGSFPEDTGPPLRGLR